MAPNENNFNADELEAPEWLNTDFFTKVLQNCVKDTSFKIKNLKLSPASAKGDHYASVMFRATVEYEVNGSKDTKEKRLIIKTMPELEGHKKNMLEDITIFETEIGMYTEVIPKFESILRSVGDKTVLSAPCVYHSLSPKKCIVFEDLVPMGYEVLRDRSPNVEECKAALLKLAIWHAVSHKIFKENPKLFEKYKYGAFTKENMKKFDFLTEGPDNFMQILNEIPELSAYKSYFEPIASNIANKVSETTTEYIDNPIDNADYILCHSDFHAKNMMFKHNKITGAFEDVILLDYQFCFIGPIVYDVIYAVFMLLDEDIRRNAREELIYYYFSNYRKTLQKIGYDGKLPKFSEFQAQWMRHKHFELYLMMVFLPMWSAIKDGSIEVEDFMTSKEKRLQICRSKVFINELQSLLPKYLHMGYFDD